QVRTKLAAEGAMEIDVRKEGQAVIISLTGRMDAVSAPQFDRTAEDLLAHGDRRIIIDFVALEYISSAGLQSILALAKRLEPVDGDVILCNLGGPVKEVFDISGFSIIFPIFDSLADAKASG
ncbi:MAG TPA: STAS domain-containing protein, partial [Syntrophales bacterium]|nr:STAS domain-containing protein [Syntrophales bacterium]